MRRVIKISLLVLLLVVTAVVVAIPLAVPRIAERMIKAKAAEFGLRVKPSVKLGYCWRNGPGIEGRVVALVVGSPWQINGRFGASFGEWSAELTVPETEFRESDDMVLTLLERHPLKGVSNLVFSGSASLVARAARTFSKPVPVWSARARVRGLDAECYIGGARYAVAGLSVSPGVSGIADHVDIAPMFPRATAVDYGAIALSNLNAAVRATERSLMVSELGAELCGGRASVYSLLLDMKSLNAGFTMFVDNVDAGTALSHFRGFEGDATGRLHGKLRMRVLGGGRGIRIDDAFLYSTPGEVGKLRMINSQALAENLAYAGLGSADRDNVAKALSDLDYSVLRLDLRRGEGNSATLSMNVSGSAAAGKTKVPVDITLNINGELEQLINASLGVKSKLKGKGK